MLEFLKQVWPIVAAFASGGVTFGCLGMVAGAILWGAREERADEAMRFDLDLPPHPFPAPIAPEPAFNYVPPRRTEKAEFEGEVIVLPMLNTRRRAINL